MSLVEAAMRTVAGLLLVRLCGCGRAFALAVAPTAFRAFAEAFILTVCQWLDGWVDDCL